MGLAPNVVAVAAIGPLGAAAGNFKMGILGTIAETEATVSEAAVATVGEPEGAALAFVSFAGDICFRGVSEGELPVSAAAVRTRGGVTPLDRSSTAATGIDGSVCPSTSDEAESVESRRRRSDTSQWLRGSGHPDLTRGLRDCHSGLARRVWIQMHPRDSIAFPERCRAD